MGRRAFVVVIDACGVGALPDAAEYGDAGADTLGHVADAVGGLDLPVLGALGLGSIAPLAGVAPAAHPVLHGRLHAIAPGKDTTAGHWALMGVVAGAAMPTYPDGLPPAIVDALRRATGRGVLGNAASEGLAAIADHGARHLETGDLIVYTSQDSVVQIAAHEALVAPAELYTACAAARAILVGEHAVGRVIARPFTGTPGRFERTGGRRDFSLDPPGRSYLEELQDAGVPVHAVGKVAQVFAGVGVDVEHPGPTNATALAATSALIGELEHGLVFTNLVDTDAVHGHRRDPAGFHEALRGIDAEVGGWLGRLDVRRDLLVITADHGCDPTSPGTDHTREHAPLLARFAGDAGRRHDGPLADVGASALRWLAGRDAELPGTAFVPAPRSAAVPAESSRPRR